jgi:glycosyltransferase involved in cell wall biosynthesis
MSAEKSGGRPRVAVFIPTRDRHVLLGETLRSVLAQTRQPDVIFVSDNAPREPAESLVSQVGEGRCRYVRHDLLKTMEEHWLWGLTAVEADFLCYLSDDDLWRPRHLETLLAAAARIPDRGLYGAACLPGAGARIPFSGDLMAPIWICDALGGSAEEIPANRYAAVSLMGTPFASCAVMLNLAHLSSVAPRASGCAVSLDAWLWAQFGAAHGAVFVPEVTSIYRVHGENAMRRFSRAAYAENNSRYLENMERLCRDRGIDLVSELQKLSASTSDATLSFFAQNLLRMYGWKRGGSLLRILARDRGERWRREQIRACVMRSAMRLLDRFLV